MGFLEQVFVAVLKEIEKTLQDEKGGVDTAGLY